MRLSASWMIFRGSDQAAVIVDNSFRRMCWRKALRRLACEGRRSASSHGESLRSHSCSRRSVPRPEFHQRMHPQIQIVHGHVGPDVAHLLLARAPHFLHVVKVLFDGRTVGERFENLRDAGIRIGAEEGVPTMIFLDQHHANHAADRRGRSPGRSCRSWSLVLP